MHCYGAQRYTFSSILPLAFHRRDYYLYPSTESVRSIFATYKIFRGINVAWSCYCAIITSVAIPILPDGYLIHSILRRYTDKIRTIVELVF